MTPIETDPAMTSSSKVHKFLNSEDNLHNTTIVDIIPPGLREKRPLLIEEAIHLTRKAFNENTTKPLSFRKKQLHQLLRFIIECENGMVEAAYKDMHKHSQEVIVAELEMVKNDIRYTILELSSWMQAERVERRYFQIFDTLLIHNDPYGLVLIISAWNYPFLLLLGPLVGAIAAGNCVILKPSELSVHCASFIQENLPKYLDTNCFCVVTGGVEFTTSLLKHKFDHITFTGSASVGRIIYKAAAEHLTPVTLELGGKCPAFFDENINIKQSTRRLLWGKCLNAGQTCMSPDYLICTKATQSEFLKCAREVILEFYGETPTSSDYLSRIINEKHFDRLVNFIRAGNCAIGGQYDATTRMISPTILTDVNPDDAVMQEEIFGPILPIIIVKSAEDALEFVRKRDKPLVAYIFTNSKKVKEMFIENTSSGALSVNDTILHIFAENSPFGGVGGSGFGAYRGKFGFDNFTHKKTILKRGFGLVSELLFMMRYPPYSDLKTKCIAVSITKRREWITYKMMKNLFVFGLGMGLALAIQSLAKHYDDNN